MIHSRFLDLKKLGAFCLLLTLLLPNLHAADTDAPAAPAAIQPQENSGSNDSLRAYLQLQELIHSMQLSIEHNQQEVQSAAAQNAAALSNRLQAVEQTVATQRSNELADTQRTNHLLLIIIGLFAVIGFAAGLFTAYFQWRAVSRLAEISAVLPVSRGLNALPNSALSLGAHEALTNGSVEQSNTRLLGFIEHLEKRIAELELTAVAPAKESSIATDGANSPEREPATETINGDNTGRITASLEHGQSLLNSDRAEEAIACFDEILALDANHTEALVKKGAALEKLRKPQEAIECYDRAIAADDSMTIAYLHKGGLCNRLERFNEAMECYERALHTQEKRRAA